MNEEEARIKVERVKASDIEVPIVKARVALKDEVSADKIVYWNKKGMIIELPEYTEFYGSEYALVKVDQ